MHPKHSLHNDRHQRLRRGAIIVLVGLLLPVLLILIGFSVDLANMQRVRTELRVATDLACKASAEALSRTGSQAEAIKIGKATAKANVVAGLQLRLKDQDFEFGQASMQDNGKWAFTVSDQVVNGVRIVGRRTADSADGPVNTFFGKLIGKATFEPSASAVAAFTYVDTCLVLDRSSSMKLSLDELGGMYVDDPRWCSPPNGSARWEDLEIAVQAFLTELNATTGQENVSMVTFGGQLPESVQAYDCDGLSDHSVVSIDCPWTTQLKSIEAALKHRSDTSWNGNTDIAAGMSTGIQLLQNARPGARRYMILLTDGRYTETNPVPLAQTAADNNITIHTITFGALQEGESDSWIADMRQIAADTGGKYMHAPTKQTLIDAFQELAENVAILIQ